MWVVALTGSLLLAYTPSARTSGDRPDRSLRDWVRDHLKPMIAAAMAYTYYVAAAWLAGADFPQFLQDHLFDGLAPAALVGLLIDFYPTADPVTAFPRIRRPVVIPIMFFVLGTVIFGLIAAAAVFSSGENNYALVVPRTALYGGLIFPVAYITQVAGPVTPRGETWWSRMMWWFRARPIDQVDRLVCTLTGHTERVWAVAIAPDGTWLVTASGDRTARIWAADGTVRAVLTGHEDVVRKVAIAPDGTWLVTASHDGTARIWAADGTPLAILADHRGWVWAVAIAPDGAWLVTASGDGAARIWAADGTLRATLGHRGLVADVAIAPDGTWLVTASHDGTARIWAADGTLRATLTSHHGSVSKVAIAPKDGTWLVTVSGPPQIWAADGTLRATLTGHKKWVGPVAIAPDGTWLVTASFDTTARIWAADGTLRAIFGYHGQVPAVAIAPDGTWLVTANEKTARIWSADGALRATLTGHKKTVGAVAIAPDGTWLATASNDTTARIWSVAGRATTVEQQAIDRLLQVAGETDWIIRPDKRTLEYVAAVLSPQESVLGVCQLWLSASFDCSFTVTDQSVYFGKNNADYVTGYRKGNERWSGLCESTPARFRINERVLRIPLAAVEECAITNDVFTLRLRDGPVITFNIFPMKDRAKAANAWIRRFFEAAREIQVERSIESEKAIHNRDHRTPGGP
jgi:WD40 repeat protein